MKIITSKTPFIIFLDIDGVFNCQLFFQERYQDAKKKLRKKVKKNEISREEYYNEQICPHRVKLFSELCEKIGAEVVISSTWRMNKTVEYLQEIMNKAGGTFKIIGKTPVLHIPRGAEIEAWIDDNISPESHGCFSYQFKRYAIIDDDSDMLLNQKEHFFQTDNYSGLTPNTCYKIKRHIELMNINYGNNG